jgi:heptosyltransferase-2
MMTPAVCCLRKHFPKARIHVLAKPWVIPVFEAVPQVDRILVYDPAGRHRGIKGGIRLVRTIKALDFDAAVLFQNAFEAALIAALSKVPMRIGYATDGRGALLTHRPPRPGKSPKIHQVDYYLGILKGVGIPDRCHRLQLTVGKGETQKAERILNQWRIRSTDRLVGMNPGAAFGPAKQWPPDRFAALGDRIRETFGATILIFGGPQDRLLGQKICQQMRHPAVNLAGRTGLAGAMALIERCRLFITNDSGLMHVASALEVPLVAVFGSTDPEVTGPRGYRGKILASRISCSPCLRPVCPRGHLECMTRIPVEAAFEAAKAFL